MWAFLRRKLYADVTGIALMWSIIANVTRDGETMYGEISLVGSCVSGVDRLCHCSVARAGSQKRANGWWRGLPLCCAAPNFQKGTPQTTVNEFLP